MWFEKLTGFRETTADDVRRRLSVDGDAFVSAANGARMAFGRLDVPTLAELRRQAESGGRPTGTTTLREVVADVQALHCDEANAGALFQVASQFNLLEMASPDVTPEAGVDIYAQDRTQGPACAIACGAGTIYRNYFADVGGKPGQAADRQIDCLDRLGEHLGNEDGRCWTMQNGYAMATADGLLDIGRRVSTGDESARDALLASIRIGVQWNTEVTIAPGRHRVSQAYCSALPVGYSRHASEDWAPFARLVLDAAYESTFCAAVVNARETGSNRVFLTLLGGGVFENRMHWILSAIERALDRFADAGLDVAIVSYGRSTPDVRDFASRW